MHRIPSPSVFTSLIIVLGVGSLPSCSGSSANHGSGAQGGEAGDALNPTGSGGTGNRGGSANGGRAGKGGAGGSVTGFSGEGGASATAGVDPGEGGVSSGFGGAMADAGESGAGANDTSSGGTTAGSGGSGEGAQGGAHAGGSGGASAGSAGAAGDAGGEAGASGSGGTGGTASCNDEIVVLASIEKPFGLVLDDDSVYFTSRALDGSVRRVSKQGGALATLADGEVYPSEIALLDDGVFWVVPGTGVGAAMLIQGSKVGGVREELHEELEHGIFSLLADDQALYHTTNYNVLKRSPLASAPSTISGGPFNSFIVDVAISNGELFWTNDGVGHFAPTEPESAGIFRRDVGALTGTTALVSRLEFPLFEIAVNESSVYFSDEAAIHRVARSGGATSVLVSLPPAPRDTSPIVDLAADEDFVFYADRHAVHRVPASGGTPVTMAEGYGAIARLALDDDYLYFTDNEGGRVVRLGKCASSSGASESTAPLTVRAPTSEAELACTGEPGPHGCPEPNVVETIAGAYGLALDENHVYYSTYAASGGIYREPLGGGDQLVIAPGEVRAHDIAVTDEYVLWALLDTASGHLAKAPKAGGARAPLATGVGTYGVGRVTSDGIFAYYITGFNSVFRVALAGGPAAIVSGGPYGSNAVDLAQFGGELFWANDGIWNATFSAKLPNTAFTAKTHAAGSTTLTGFTLDAPLDYPLHRITADANAVYYIDEALLYRVSRSGGDVTELGSLAPATGAIVDLETDGQHLYFADVTSVYRMPVTGGDVATVTSGWAGLRSIGVNADSVYFTDFASGAVLGMPK